MPFATNREDGVRIHYESEGSGLPLVIHHGFGSSGHRWRERGWTGSLGSELQLIFIDGRGHGESDRPTDAAAYDARLRAMDVASVLNNAEIQQAHYLGYSMGSLIGMACAIYTPQRFRSLILGGYSPGGASDSPMANQGFEEVWEGLKDRPDASREAWAACVEGGGRFGGAVQALRTTSVPLLMFAGSGDTSRYEGVKQFCEQQGTPWFALDGKSHIEASHEIDEIAPRVLEFVRGIEGS